MNKSCHWDCILQKLQSVNQKGPFLLNWPMLYTALAVGVCKQTFHSGMTSVYAAAREGRGQSSEQKTIKMFSNLLD